MKNKPNKLNFSTLLYFFTLEYENEDFKAIEGLINTLAKLEIASEYYQDYDCYDRDAFIRKLKYCASFWRAKEEVEKLYKIHFKGLLQSHQSNQDLKLVEQRSKNQYPSTFRVDSS